MATNIKVLIYQTKSCCAWMENTKDKKIWKEMAKKNDWNLEQDVNTLLEM